MRIIGHPAQTSDVGHGHGPGNRAQRYAGAQPEPPQQPRVASWCPVHQMGNSEEREEKKDEGLEEGSQTSRRFYRPSPICGRSCQGDVDAHHGGRREKSDHAQRGRDLAGNCHGLRQTLEKTEEAETVPVRSPAPLGPPFPLRDHLPSEAPINDPWVRTNSKPGLRFVVFFLPVVEVCWTAGSSARPGRDGAATAASVEGGRTTSQTTVVIGYDDWYTIFLVAAAGGEEALKVGCLLAAALMRLSQGSQKVRSRRTGSVRALPALRNR